MKEAHRDILSKVLHPGGWIKVHDKDFKITHRVVYFNNIKKAPEESDTAHIQWVNKIREMRNDI